MGTVPVSKLLDIWAFRLRMDDKRGRTWTPQFRSSAEGLVERLRSLPDAQAVIIDADEARDPIARFVHADTGETLGEIYKAPRN